MIYVLTVSTKSRLIFLIDKIYLIMAEDVKVTLSGQVLGIRKYSQKTWLRSWNKSKFNF